MKLHLGCGQNYLDGYVNIDYPATEHTIQQDARVDRYADIVTLDFPDASIDEVRLHHVFEHFPRSVALALLARWRRWLRPGGLLRLETPDAMACFKQLTSPFLSHEQKQQVMRHLFGSHEAHWAVHQDGWYDKKFRRTLERFGFEKLQFEKRDYALTRNIEVAAVKSATTYGDEDYREAAKAILFESTVKTDKEKPLEIGDTETNMLNVWLSQWDAAYHHRQPVESSSAL